MTKECINCGYERQPKDDEHGLVPKTECPRCGAIYEKMEKLRERYPSTIHPEISRRQYRKKPQRDAGSNVKAKKSSNLLVYVVIAAVCVSAGYYYYTHKLNKQSEASSIAQVSVRVFTTAT